MRKITTFLCLVIAYHAHGQGHIDHIKKQLYLKEGITFNCDSLPGDNLSERICANLAFQKSDSLLTVVYNKLLADVSADTKKKIVSLQSDWRIFRHRHCSLFSPGGGSVAAINYLKCMKELTDDRVKELESLLNDK